MKKITIILIAVLCTMTTSAQTTTTSNNDNVGVYRLFPTENMWTFLQLNTRTGQIWQIQFDVQGDNRGSVILNHTPLVSSSNEINGRFTLYPTQNRWTFILLDTVDGRTWQVQWSQEANRRFIIRID